MSTVQEIEQAAMKLPAKKRAILAERLLVSLKSKRGKVIAEAWATEAEQRIDAYEAGTMKTVSAEVVLRYRGRTA